MRETQGMAAARQRQPESLAKSRHVLSRPELLLAAAFLFSLPLYPPNARYILGSGASSSFATAFLIGAFSSVFAMCLGTLVYSVRHLAWPGFPRRGVLACAVCYVCGVAALWAGVLTGTESTMLGAATGIAIGVSFGAVVCQWIQVFGHSFRTAVFYGGAAVAIMYTAHYLLSRGPLWLTAVVSVVAAAVGALSAVFLEAPDAGAYWATHHDRALSLATVVAELRGYLSVVGLPIVGLLICCFSLSLYSYSTETGLSTDLVGALLAAIMAMLVAVLVRRVPFVVFVESVFLPIVMAVSLFLGSQAPGSPLFMVGMFTINGPLFFVVIYALAAMVCAVNSGDFPLPFVFVSMLLGVTVVVLAGFLLSLRIEDSITAGNILWTFIAIFAVICIIRTVMRYYRSIASPDVEGDVAPSVAEDGAVGSDDGEGMVTPAAPAAQADLAALQAEAIRAIAEEHALSKRETEVFDLMARGYGSAFIAQTLFISDNTARTHVRNIYRKLGVNSRTELLGLLNER